MRPPLLRRRALAAALTLTAVLAPPSLLAAQNWPSFRGPDASGVAAAGPPPI